MTKETPYYDETEIAALRQQLKENSELAIAAARHVRFSRPVLFNPCRQCHWCGSDNTKGARGYGGERGCPTCRCGGEGERDVPCMFYKITATI